MTLLGLALLCVRRTGVRIKGGDGAQAGTGRRQTPDKGRRLC